MDRRGAAAIFGHMFSIFLGFKGGKGVATSTGVALGLYPYYTFPALAALAVFILVVLVTHMSASPRCWRRCHSLSPTW